MALMARLAAIALLWLNAGAAAPRGVARGGPMADNPTGWSTLADKQAVEAVPLADRLPAETVYAMLRATAAAHPRRPAISFQIKPAACWALECPQNS